MTAKIDLNGQLAELYRLSPNNSRISKHITQAKTALGITAPRRLIDDEKQAVYQWHVKNISQLNQSSDCDTVETFSQLDDGNSVEIISQYEMNDTVRIAFYTVGNGVKKRQVIALDGFYVNALMLVAGVDKKGVPAWVQREVDGWLAFDSRLPITRQVKYLIVRELTQRVKNSTG